MAFLPVDGDDNLPKLFSPFSRVGGSFVLSLRSPVGRFPPGLQTLDEWIGRREAGIASLTLDAYLLLDLGTVESVVLLSATCNVSYKTFIL